MTSRLDDSNLYTVTETSDYKTGAPLIIENLANYKRWADSVFYDSLSNLPVEEFEKQRPMLFGSILALLNHVYAMDIVWRSNLEGVEHNVVTRNPGGLHAFANLREKQIEVNVWYEIYFAQLSGDELRESVYFNFIGGGKGKIQRTEILQHVVNHASYHRGHIEGVMYQMSVEPPTTDMPVFLQTEIA